MKQSETNRIEEKTLRKNGEELEIEPLSSTVLFIIWYHFWDHYNTLFCDDHWWGLNILDKHMVNMGSSIGS